MGAAVGVVASVFMGGAGGGLLGGLLGNSLLGQLLSGFLGGAEGAGGEEGISKAMAGFAPANVLNATTNLVNSILGNGTNKAMEKLHKEEGLPKFIQDDIAKVVEKVLKENKCPTDPECQKALDQATKGDADKTTEDLAKKIVENILKQLEEEGKDNTSSNRCGGEEGKDGKKGKRSTGSWLQKIAQALGEVLGEKAAKMVELSEKISEAADAQKKAAGTKDEGDDKEAAAEMTKLQTEMQGVSQEYKLLSETVSTCIKGIGEGCSTLGRKQ